MEDGGGGSKAKDGGEERRGTGPGLSPASNLERGRYGR